MSNLADFIVLSSGKQMNSLWVYEQDETFAQNKEHRNILFVWDLTVVQLKM